MAGAQSPLRQSLQFRLSAWVSALLLGVAVVAGAFSFITAFEEANELQDDTLRQIAALIDRNHLPVATASEQLPEFASDSDVQVVVQRLPNARETTPRSSATPLLLSAELPDGLQTVMIEDESWRLFVTTLAADRRFVVGQQTAVRDETARDGALRTLMPFVILIPILLLVLRDVIRRMLKPMRDLATELDGRSDQDLGALVATGLPTEVRPFVVAINRMLTRVEQSVSQQRRFLVDAAHELRSPLTALSLQAERLAGTPMSDAAGERLAALRQGIRRAQLLLEQLLTLARVQDAPSAAATPVSVHNVFRQVIEELHPQATAKSIDIGVTSEQDVSIALAEFDLQTLVRNLVTTQSNTRPWGAESTLRSASMCARWWCRSATADPALRRKHVRACSSRFTACWEMTRSAPALGSRSSRRSPIAAALRWRWTMRTSRAQRDCG